MTQRHILSIYDMSPAVDDIRDGKALFLNIRLWMLPLE